ncbi:hypothetical protein DFQ28_005788 [Apophysomyces sp. BC1034]|nr:hypothetical protein DFQ30_005742 [Apophysomyces sp. BC1015]KAG0176967.1 hypothetical protein DFQ29_005415 [Apophysomyces sp. BC1021]KAG0187841.1 hypothetical protein DFQ28_005788 [Apophysomyces sp. BC1034]
MARGLYTILALALGVVNIVAAAENPFPMPKCNGFELEEASIDAIQEALSSGKLTSRDLVKCYLDRIDLINPYMHAVIETNPDVYEIADQLDSDRYNNKTRGPLHGIPILVKDNIATDDRMETTCGSNALVGSKVPRDAHVIALLRKAGAIIFGKANLAEWADIRSTNYSEGWSARGGQSRNAYNLTQNPAGSSSGSAHAVTANLVTVAIGTETDGSVIGPAQRAGLVGIKPTVGLTSRDGVIPESHSQDTVGTFGRTFKDAVYVLDAIKGVDARDPVTKGQKGRVPKRFARFVTTKGALDGVRIGIPWKAIWQAPTTRSSLPQLFSAIDELRAAGAIIVNNTNIPTIDEIAPSPPQWDWAFKNSLGRNNQSEFTVVCYEFKRDLNKYLSQLKSSPVRSLADIITYNDAHYDAEMKYFKQETLIQCDSDPFTKAEYTAAKAYILNKTRKEGIDAALKNYNVSALLAPSDNWSMTTQISAQAGYPIVTVPAGHDPWGVPFGISLWGTAYSESTLIKLGSAIDDALRRRQPPQFLDYETEVIPVQDAYGAIYN